MIRWLRIVVPPAYVAAFWLLFAICCGVRWLPGVGSDDLRPLCRVLVCGGALAYGFYRAASRVPSTGSDYYRFLLATPYDGSLSLPNGPIHLVIQDWVLVGAVETATWATNTLPWGSATMALLTGHSAALSFFLLDRGARTGLFITLVGMALTVGVMYMPLVGAAAAGATYGAAHLYLRGVLRRLPRDRVEEWDELREVAWKSVPLPIALLRSRHAQSLIPAAALKCLGWPLSKIGPVRLPQRWTDWSGWVAGALAALWFYSLATGLGHISSPRSRLGDGEAWAFAGVVGAMAVLSRVANYCVAHHFPISLAGRIATRRIVIPGYDRVFVAPLAGALAFAACWWVQATFGLPAIASASVGVGAAVGLVVGGPPSLETWRLTGEYRLVFGSSSFLGVEVTTTAGSTRV